MRPCDDMERDLLGRDESGAGTVIGRPDKTQLDGSCVACRTRELIKTWQDEQHGTTRCRGHSKPRRSMGQRGEKAAPYVVRYCERGAGLRGVEEAPQTFNS